MGAFLGPLFAVGLMLLWPNDFRAVFWVVVIPGVLAVALLVFGVREPRMRRPPGGRAPIDWRLGRRLNRAYWGIVLVGVVFTLARFSEAFLILRAQQGGLPTAWVPLVLVAMNAVYAAFGYQTYSLTASDLFGTRRVGLAVSQIDARMQGLATLIPWAERLGRLAR